MLEDELRKLIRDVPDFPKKGIMFKDLTPVLADPEICRQIISAIHLKFKYSHIDAIACLESRGFWFGMLLSQAFNVPFIPIRKKGKLPLSTHSFDYSLEYGNETIEMHTDAIKPSWNVLIHDDVLATGGTASAAAELILMAGAKIAGFAFVLSLEFLNGKEKISKYSHNIQTIVPY